MKKYTTKCSLLIILSFVFCGFFFAETSYKVEKGDTLYSISRKYQITVAELRAANNLSENDILKAGQKLIIPEADIGTASLYLHKKKLKLPTQKKQWNMLFKRAIPYTVLQKRTI